MPGNIPVATETEMHDMDIIFAFQLVMKSDKTNV